MSRRILFSGFALALGCVALPTAASADEGFARSAGVLRAGPASNYPRVAAVGRGDALEVYGCLSNYAWCDVADGEDRGWIQGSRIGFLRNGQNVYISNNASVLGLSILTFGLGDYWGTHYENRPWVNDRRWNRNPRPPQGDFAPNPRPPMDGQQPNDNGPPNGNRPPHGQMPGNPPGQMPGAPGRPRANPVPDMPNQPPVHMQPPAQRPVQQNPGQRPSDAQPQQRQSPQQQAPQQRPAPQQQAPQQQAPRPAAPQQNDNRPAPGGAPGTKCLTPDGC